MNKPKMILFDYGHTLLAEPGYNGMNGTKAVMKYAVKNPRNYTPGEVNSFANEIFYSICQQTRDIGIELHEHNYMRLLYEYLEIEFSLSYEEIESVYWDNAAVCTKMPNIEAVLEYLNENKIRSGVISNIGFSGSALKSRINRLLPENHFEFIIASSEYMIRKPNPLLFELALRKAGLEANGVWFCGDSVSKDVAGAVAVGMFPVWYEDMTIENLFRDKSDKEPDCEHLHIHDWMELIEFLAKLT